MKEYPPPIHHGAASKKKSSFFRLPKLKTDFSGTSDILFKDEYKKVARKPSKAETVLDSIISADSPINFDKDTDLDFSTSYLFDSNGTNYSNINTSTNYSGVFYRNRADSFLQNSRFTSTFFTNIPGLNKTESTQNLELPPYWEKRSTLSKFDYYCDLISDKTSFELPIDKSGSMIADYLNELSIKAKDSSTIHNHDSGKEFLKAALICSKEREISPNRFKFYDFQSIKKSLFNPNKTINDLLENFRKNPSVIPKVTWEILSTSITYCVSLLDHAIISSNKVSYIECAEEIIYSIKQVIFILNCPNNENGLFIRYHTRQLINHGCDLLLSAAVASGTWPPPDSEKRLKSNAIVLLSKTNKFISEAQKNGFTIAQLTLNDLENYKNVPKNLKTLKKSKSSQIKNILNSKSSIIDAKFNGSKVGNFEFFRGLNGSKSLEDFQNKRNGILFKSKDPNIGSKISLASPPKNKMSISTTDPNNGIHFGSTNVLKSDYEKIFEKSKNLFYVNKDATKKSIPVLILNSVNSVETESIKLANALNAFEQSVKTSMDFFSYQNIEPILGINSKRSSYFSSIGDNSHSNLKSNSQFVYQIPDLTTRCQKIVSSVGAFVNEVSKIEKIVSYCGLDDNLITLADALSEGSKSPNPQKINYTTLFSSSEIFSSEKKKSYLPKFQSERDELVSSCVKAVSMTQDLSFLSPQLIYFNQEIDKNIKSRKQLIPFHYNNNTVKLDLVNSFIYTNLPDCPISPISLNSTSPISFRRPSIQTRDTSLKEYTESSFTHDELFGIGDSDPSFKNLVHVINKPSNEDPIHIDTLIQLNEALSKKILMNLDSLFILIQHLDKLCFSLWMSSKLILDSCSRKILNSLYKYLSLSRLLPPQSSHRPKKSVKIDTETSGIESNNYSDFKKSIPIIPKESEQSDDKDPRTNELDSNRLNKSNISSKSYTSSIESSKKKKNLFFGKINKSISNFGNSKSHANLRLSDKLDLGSNYFSNYKGKDPYSLPSPKSPKSPKKMYSMADFNTSKSSVYSKVISTFTLNSEDSDGVVSKKSEHNTNPQEENQHSYVISSQNTQAWFLKYDYKDDELIILPNGSVKAGTLSAMVERLTAHDVLDTQFVSTFMLTYHSFTTTPRVFGLLFKRYAIEPPAELNQKDFATWEQRKLIPVRIRVFNILKRWLKEYFYYNIEGDLDALEMLRLFASTIMIISQPAMAKQLIKTVESFNKLIKSFDGSLKAKKGGGSIKNNTTGNNSDEYSDLEKIEGLDSSMESNNSIQLGSELEQKIGYLSQSYGYMSARKRIRDFPNSPPPQPILPEQPLDNYLSLIHIDTNELARQICIIDYSLLNKVRPAEFLRKAWMTSAANPKAVNGLTIEIAYNLRAVSAFSTRFSNFVISMILKNGELDMRVKFLEYFIDLGQKLWILNNYNGLMSIIGALQSTPIERLKQTWSSLSPKTLNAFNSLCSVMSSSKNYSNYRESLKSISPPAIPFIGLALSDLTFIEDGNPELHENTEGMINFLKHRQISDVIQQIQLFQYTPFPLLQVNEIISFFFSCLKQAIPFAPSEENLSNLFYKLSEAVE
ncbi:Cell division control protein 25 [Smittium culicis]|uniref:Cell division control protein 25 n=1 Tax=Smittium culicis TaxID=133412 RepID=A0A1R1Y8M2_9FUNG|nr:Cell division control protein 25 [Smittium culicis]